MIDGPPPQPYGQSGLTVLGLINVVTIAYLIGEISTVSKMRTAQSTSVTIAEAAYIGALWTKTGAYAALLLAFDVFCIRAAVCVRITQLHRATLWQAGARPQT